MSLFFETIKIQNGKIYNASYHNQRLNRTIRENFSLCPHYNILDYITPPGQKGLFRCKLLYDTQIRKISITPYQKKTYHSFYCIESDIEYRYKAADRSKLENLFSQKESCDDIIILKDGLLCDTSIANIALYDGREWYTPQKPLLEGSFRASLLAEKKIKTKDLDLKSLQNYTKFAIMNAMTGFYQLKNITFKF